MTDGLNLQWREPRDEDRNYIISSWARSYAESPEFSRLPRDTYFALYEPVVKRLIERSTVAIAWDEELPNTVLGWMAVEGDNVLHYFCTKRRFRKMGVAKWMLRDLQAMPAIYTHQPPTAGALKLIGASWVFEPKLRFERNAA